MRTLLIGFVLISLPSISLAVPVNPDAPDGIAAMISLYEAYHAPGVIALCTTGEIKGYDGRGGWGGAPAGIAGSVPVPVDEIADWGVAHVTTKSGDHYLNTNSLGWLLVGSPNVDMPCIPPVSSEPQSMGDIKAMFR